MTRRDGLFIFIGVAAGAAAIALLLWIRLPIVESVPPTVPAPDSAGLPPAQDPAGGPIAADVQLSADEQRKAGVQTAAVRRQTLAEQVVAVGRVEDPETSIRTVSARVGGRIDRLFVNFTGQPVKNGQPVAEIYSPEIVTAAEEYKLAIENRRHLAASRQSAALEQAEALIAASRRRLELWGLTSEQIEELAASPETPVHITIASSASGIIRTRNVTEGQYVKAGDSLFEVVDLSTVWVGADVFQPDISKVRPGMRAQITSDAVPGASLRGTVGFIEPQSDPQKRTTTVRLHVDNPGMRLRPGMFVTATFAIPVGTNVLTVPRSAVIDTGTEKIVYIAQPDGVFQRRAVQTLAPTKDDYPIVGGLSENDTVVTHGAFLIDSQSRLGGTLTGLFGGSTSFSETAPAGAAAKYSIAFRIEPDPPHGAQESMVHVTLQDAAGNPVSDAQVRLQIIMPAMPAMGMPEMRSAAELKWDGSAYTGPLSVTMAGPWNVVVEARRGNEVLATYRTRFDAR